jgi:biopolymer transport protein ExbB
MWRKATYYQSASFAAIPTLLMQWLTRLYVPVALATLVIATPVVHSARAQGAPAGPLTPATTPAAAPAAPSAAVPPEMPAAGAAIHPAQTPEPGVAPPNSGAVTTVGGDLLPQRLSFEGMIRDADWVVKAVMAGLAFASLVTWTVFFAKIFELYRAGRGLRRALRVLGNAPTFAKAYDELGNGKTAAAQLMREADHEIALSANVRGDGLKERIALQLERLETAVSRKISLGTGVLATISSTAPFVGLFGTVWGIMNSFIGISNAHTTNLAVVAPGIAQALLATAFGLFAAIPAVMIYNLLARLTANYRALLGNASAQILRLVSRDLDYANLRRPQAAE